MLTIINKLYDNEIPFRKSKRCGEKIIKVIQNVFFVYCVSPLNTLQYIQNIQQIPFQQSLD